MVADTSALLAILLGESEQERYLGAILADDDCVVSAVSTMEAVLVLHRRRGPPGVAALWKLLEACGVEVVPFDRRQAELAGSAHRRFGKGHHPARLNLGDCCAYALAKSRGEPLLFKGQDFAQTDIVPALR